MATTEVMHLTLRPAPEGALKFYFDIIRSKANITRITTLEDADSLFTGTTRPPIFTDDATLCRPECRQVRAHAFDYIRSGGTVIVMGAGGASMGQVSDFFEEVGLPWKAASYYTEEFSLNSTFNQFDINELPPQYAMKAAHLIDVERKDCVYGPTPESEYGALALRERVLDDPVDEEIVAVACARVGDGRIGYIGDASYEKETARVLLAMLGVR